MKPWLVGASTGVSSAKLTGVGCVSGTYSAKLTGTDGVKGVASAFLMASLALAFNFIFIIALIDGFGADSFA
jgi:hypothetical protein